MPVTQAISTIPTPPSRTDKATFDERADSFLGHFPTLQAELEAFRTQFNSVESTINTKEASSTTKAAEAAASADTAATAAATATTKASEASASALTASEAATTATTKAGEAASAVDTATTAATTATTKASEASASAAAALSSKIDAETAKDATVSAKDTAVSAASTATTKAGEAVTSASSAATAKIDAESAKDTAILAKDAAVSAKDTAVSAASTATTKASEASDSATAAAASAATAAEISIGAIPYATTAIAGKIQIATTETVQAGTEAAQAVTPATGAATYATLGHNHATVYAPIANGVTNGDSHNHSGGDGATISYTSLSDLPTIPVGAETTPANLGSAQPGTASALSRADHIHNMPTAAQVGALASGADINISDYKVQRPYLQDWAEVVNAMGSISGAQTIDLELGNVVTATITAATQFTFSNPPESGRAGGFVLILTNGGAGVVTWPTSCKGLPPALTASGTDILAFLVTDGGTTYNCSYKLDVK